MALFGIKKQENLNQIEHSTRVYASVASQDFLKFEARSVALAWKWNSIARCGDDDPFKDR